MQDRLNHIRNFSIIAHIDHGKSTLADRLIEKTGVVTSRELSEQMLDNMDIEKERGITIKLQSVRMEYMYKGEKYILNLIDTPGHVDFTYEVSRSLAACEGALLVVDATQGVEAQTLTNVYLALDNDLEILPVLNKIDLASADVEATKSDIENTIGIDTEGAPLVSAKTGLGVDELLDKIIEVLPAPNGDINAPFKALIFDSVYDNYKGAVSFVRVIDGKLKVGDTIKMFSSGKEFEVTEVGYLNPRYVPQEEILCGDVGYIAASIKTVSDTRVGDTITLSEGGCTEALPGYKEVKPMVFAGIYPADGSKYNELKESLEKLKLNDASLHFEPEVSQALGFGFRCGFLGLLHMDIIEERLEREYNLDIITTAPSVSYKVFKTNGEELMVENPSHLPSLSEVDHIQEPYVKASIYTPPTYVGNIMEICTEKRGEYKDMTYLDTNRVCLTYEMPLNEIIYDFFDAIKSCSKGYASFDYEIIGYRTNPMVKLDILLNGDICDALSIIVHKDRAYYRGRTIAERLKDIIPRQMFEIPIQAAVGGKIIARETVKAMRKDVLAKCYGGDITRKKKLLEKQKKGKKRMRQIGTVEVPSEAFMSILKYDNDNKK